MDFVGAEAPEIQACCNVPAVCAAVISAAVTGAAKACVDDSSVATAKAILVNFTIVLQKISKWRKILPLPDGLLKKLLIKLAYDVLQNP
jgi:hypothetical protein